MIFERQQFVNQLIEHIDNNMIKVVTGRENRLASRLRLILWLTMVAIATIFNRPLLCRIRRKLLRRNDHLRHWTIVSRRLLLSKMTSCSVEMKTGLLPWAYANS